MRVVITGAGGNLGGKLTAHLQAAPWCTAIVGIDPKPLTDSAKFRAVSADLRDPRDQRWIGPVSEADAIVHFAAQNPAPDSTWLEATQSLDMTLNLLHRARDHDCRFVFASSNHVMGGYQNAPLPADGKLSGATPPLPGTTMFNGQTYVTPTAYGASKLMGERAVVAAAAAGRMTGVNVRVGWVQPGENHPETIGLHGGGTNYGPGIPAATEEQRAMRWFRSMWLSNADFLQLMEKAITRPATAWPAPAILVCGMSNNDGMAWDLTTGRDLLGYAPADNVWMHLPR